MVAIVATQFITQLCMRVPFKNHFSFLISDKKHLVILFSNLYLLYKKRNN